MTRWWKPTEEIKDLGREDNREEDPEHTLSHGYTNSYTHITHSENGLKTGRTDLSQVIGGRRLHWRGWGGGALVGNLTSGGNTHKWEGNISREKQGDRTPRQVPMAPGDPRWEEEPTNIWLWKPLGLNFRSFKNQQGSTRGTTKICGLNASRARGQQETEFPPLKSQYSKSLPRDTWVAVWKVPGVYV